MGIDYSDNAITLAVAVANDEQLDIKYQVSVVYEPVTECFRTFSLIIFFMNIHSARGNDFHF